MAAGSYPYTLQARIRGQESRGPNWLRCLYGQYGMYSHVSHCHTDTKYMMIFGTYMQIALNVLCCPGLCSRMDTTELVGVPLQGTRLEQGLMLQMSPFTLQ